MISGGLLAHDLVTMNWRRLGSILVSTKIFESMALTDPNISVPFLSMPHSKGRRIGMSLKAGGQVGDLGIIGRLLARLVWGKVGRQLACSAP